MKVFRIASAKIEEAKGDGVSRFEKSVDALVDRPMKHEVTLDDLLIYRPSVYKKFMRQSLGFSAHRYPSLSSRMTCPVFADSSAATMV